MQLETREEFDVKWMVVASKSGLSGNGWLQSIYRIRSTWVPTYVNHVFLQIAQLVREMRVDIHF